MVNVKRLLGSVLAVLFIAGLFFAGVMAVGMEDFLVWITVTFVIAVVIGKILKQVSEGYPPVNGKEEEKKD